MGFLLCLPKDHGAESWLPRAAVFRGDGTFKKCLWLFCAIDKYLEISKQTKYKEIEEKIFSEMYSQIHLLCLSSHRHGSEKGLVDGG